MHKFDLAAVNMSPGSLRDPLSRDKSENGKVGHPMFSSDLHRFNEYPTYTYTQMHIHITQDNI